MAVYVDPPKRYEKKVIGGNGKPVSSSYWSHMMTDGYDQELLDFAAAIGLKPEWVQSPGTYNTHFDITTRMRMKAVKNGAIEITDCAMADMCTISKMPRDVFYILEEDNNEYVIQRMQSSRFRSQFVVETQEMREKLEALKRALLQNDKRIMVDVAGEVSAQRAAGVTRVEVPGILPQLKKR